MPDPTTVKGISHCTYSRYRRLRVRDPDTLYFIRDKGLVFRGESIVIPTSFTQVDGPDNGSYHFHVETYSRNGTVLAIPDVLDFSVYGTDAVDAIVATLTAAIATRPDWDETDPESLAYIRNKTRVMDARADAQPFTAAKNLTLFYTEKIT